MIPGQLGPTMRDLLCVLSMSVMRTMSASVSLQFLQVTIGFHTVLGNALGDTVHCKFPCTSVSICTTYVTIRGTSAVMASSILAAATGGLCGG